VANTSIEQVIATVGIIVNICGFIFVIRQIRQQALATRGETYASLCGLSYEILSMMAERPHLYAYFYENKALDDAGDHRVEVLCCAEMIANYCDNTALQRENIPDQVWMRWRNFIVGQCETSQVLRDFLTEYQSWYSPEIGEILDQMAAARLPK